MSLPFSFAVLYKRLKKADIIFLLKCLIRFKRNPSGLAFLFYYYFLMESYSLLVQYSSVSLPCLLLFSFYVLKINIQMDTKFWSFLITYISPLLPSPSPPPSPPPAPAMALFHLFPFFFLKPTFLPPSPLLFWLLVFLTPESNYCVLH